MKRILQLILLLLFIFTFSACKKDDASASYEDITYEFTSNLSGKYSITYIESGGAQNNISFTGKTWIKTIPGGKAPQQYVIIVIAYDPNGVLSTLKISKGGKVVKSQDFQGIMAQLQYNTQ